MNEAVQVDDSIGVTNIGRVLVIDDAASAHGDIARVLRNDGFEVFEARPGDLTLDAHDCKQIDVIVLDLDTTEPERADLCRRLKKSIPHFLPVLTFSSDDSHGTRARALDAGFDECLARPVDPFELRASTGALVRLNREAGRSVLDAALERERLVASLETERARLAAIFEEAPAFLAVLIGPDYVFERVNPAYLQLVGHRDPVGKPLLVALPEVEGQGFVELLDAVRTTGVPFSGKQMPVRLSRTPHAPLELRYLDLVYQRLADASGAYSVVAHGVDVTEQVLVSIALRRSEQRLRDQFAKFPVPTYLWEAQGDDFILLDCNDAATRAFPEVDRSAIGRLFSEILPDLHALRADYQTSLRENIVVRRVTDFERPGDRGKVMLELTIGPQLPDRILVHAVDMTERAELEAQLRQAQKMDAIGRLAGGVAHDFNNLLTVIGAHSSFLLESLEAGDPRHVDAEEIQKSALRAAALTRQLLAFSRKQILKPTLLDLNEIVENTRKMLERLLGEDIEIVTHLEPQLSAVLADATQIDQALVNLAVNARDAMPDGGVLTIRSRDIDLPEEARSAYRSVPPGRYSVLEVSDTGIGMDVDVRARLFEPFFTTKKPGKGTGLGLATVYGIVKQSSGYVLVDSAPGEGSTFQLYLPAAASVPKHIANQPTNAALVGGTETILLIEDERAVRDVAQRILTKQGYEVLLAASGAEALDVSASYESRIDLVISDSVMPGMTGAEVVRRLQQQRAGLKALFMSGYTDDEILRRGIVSSASAFIHKPFSIQDFCRAARSALDT